MKKLSNEQVIQINKGNIKYLQFKKLLQYEEIISHGYSLGLDVNYRTCRDKKNKLPKEEFEKAINNYKNLCDSMQIDYKNIVKTNQGHTDNIVIIENKINLNQPDINLEQYQEIDGLITNQPNLILSTTNADCILMLFFDPVTKTIANVHSGWRGTLQRIASKTVEKMQKELRCSPSDIICCICPSIRKCHFEVDLDVKEKFENEFKEIESKIFIYKQKYKEKWNIDTILLNKIILEQEGLKPENIIDSGICSMCQSDIIHSFRAEKKGYGLNTALIQLK